MTKLAAVLALLLTAGCGGSSISNGAAASPTPDPTLPPTASQAELFVNDAVLAGLATGSGVTLDENRSRAILTGAIVVDGATVTFSGLALSKRPFSVDGTVTATFGDHALSMAFAHGTAGAYTVDGLASGSVTAKIPMVSSFVQATAGWAMQQAWHPGAGFAAGACNVAVTDDGNGGILIDGTCTVCNVTVTITQLDIDPAGMTINGTIAVDDGNGNTALLTFAGTTVDVMVNGQDLGTFDLSQIFGGP